MSCYQIVMFLDLTIGVSLLRLNLFDAHSIVADLGLLGVLGIIFAETGLLIGLVLSWRLAALYRRCGGIGLGWGDLGQRPVISCLPVSPGANCSNRRRTGWIFLWRKIWTQTI